MPGPIRHLRSIGVASAVLIASVALSGCGSYKKEFADYQYGLHGAPTPAQQAAALHATRAYRTLIVQASQRFAAAAGKLRDAAERGDLVEARRQWAIAQASYDVFRGEIIANSTTELAIAGRLQDQPFFIGRTGLHAIEADLFSPDHSRLVEDASSLAGKGMLIQIGLMRTIRTPERIMNTAAQSISWAINQVIAHPQEPYAQRDLLDIAAVVTSVSSMVDAVSGLGQIVAPRDLATVKQRLATLEKLLDSVSQGSTEDVDITRNNQISAASWRLLSVQMTALVGPLTTLGGDMDGFGTGRTYA
jgi:iron uptake system EfeUOB component EfeO/EfeM